MLIPCRVQHRACTVHVLTFGACCLLSSSAVRRWADAAYKLQLPARPASSSSNGDCATTAAGDVFSLSAATAAGPRMSPQQCNDRLRQHTQHCTVCSKALAGLKTKLWRAQAAAAACLAGLMGLVGSVLLPRLIPVLSGAQQAAAAAGSAAVVTAAAGISSGPVGVAAALVGVGALVAVAVARSTAALIQRFEYVEFSHADNH